MKRLAFVFAAIVLMCPNLFADQITLKNGDRLTGDIVKSDEKSLVIKSEFAGDVTVQWAAVEAIRSTQTLHVGLKDGQTIVGTVTTTGGKIQLQTRDAGPVIAAKDSIVVIRSDKEQAAYDAKMDRLQHPHLLDYWGGFLDTGLSTTKGNSDTLSFTIGAKAVRAAPSDKITVFANSIFAKNSSTGTSVTTARAIKGGIRADLNVSPRTFAFGFTNFEFDQFQQLDLRNILGGGVGYHAVKTPHVAFDLSGGGAYDQAYYSTGVNLRNAALVAGEEFSYQFSKRSSFSEHLQFFPNMGSLGQYRATFDSTMTTRINSWINWQVTFGDQYVSNPIPGVKKNDILLTTGIRLTYGKGGQ